MTTMEKLFVQIFERKNWIIEQVKQHTDLYTHQQVSKLIIEGITPHPSLWNPNSHSQSSDPKELNKEELISKILLRQPRELVPYSSGVCSLYYGTVATGDNGGISNGLCMETNASNNGLNARDGPTIVLDDRDNDVGCTLNCVPEQDGIVNSTQDEIDVRISNIYTAPDKSLARIQRSKSRQKALELRTSAKAASKSCLSHKIETRISFSGVSSSKTGLHEADQNKSSSKSPNHFGTNRGSSVLRDANEANCSKGHDRSSYNGRVTRSRSSYKQPTIANECIEVDGSSEMEKEVNSMPVLSTDYSLQQSDQVNCLMEMMNPPDATFGSCGVREATTGNTWDKQRGSNVYCGRITRSRSSSQQASGINESSKPGASSYNAKECSGTLAQSIGNIMQQLDASSELMEAVKPSGELIDKMIRTRATCSNKDTLKPISYSNIAACLVTRSRSGATKESLNEVEGYALQNALGGKIIPFNFDVDREGNAEIAVVTEVVDGPVQMQPVYSGSNLDDVNLRMELKGLVSSPPPNDYMAVEPKQLDFDTEECNLNEIFSPPSTNRRLGKSSEKAYSTSLELAASADAVTHDNPNQSFFEHESSVGMNVARKPEEAWKHSDVNVEECIEDKMSKFGSNIKENPTVKIVKYDSTAIHNENSCVLHVADITPSDIPGNNFDEEVHPEKCQLTEGYRSSLKMLIEEGDLGYKLKNESAATLCISKLKYSEASCSSSLAKQRTDYSQDCLDKEVRIHEATELLGEDEIVGCPKSTELESGKLTLPNMSFNSAKADSWPRYKRRKVEDQQNCFSTSGGFRVQLTHNIKKDTVNRDLKALEGDLGYKSKNESAATLCISKLKYSEASCSSSLAKQRTDYSQDCLDKEVRIHEATELLGEDEIVGYPKSTELESGKLTLPNMSFNSAKADSWPRYKRRKVEDQQNCFSTSGGFRVQLTHNIKKDTVNRDLKALEGDLGYKSKNESEATLCISKPKYSEASFSSSLAKQRTDYSQDCLDKEVRIHEATELLGEDEIVGCPKSTELESGQLTLPNMSFNSAKADSWPQYKRRKVEDQQNCFSTTEGFRVQLTQNIKKDTVNRDLRALENDSDSLEFQLVSLSEERYVFQSNANTSCDSEIHQKMKCHLTEGIESSHTLQTAEADTEQKLSVGFGFEVENKTAETPFTFKHLRPTCASNLAKKASDNPTDIVVEDVETADLTSKDYPPVCHDEDRVNMVNADIMTVERNLPERKAHVRGDGLLSYCSVGSPNNSDKNLIGPDETMPVFEGFIIDEHTENVGVDMTGCGIDFGSLDFPSTAFERASILEQICKFTSMQTPLSHYSSSLELNSMQDLHRSVPNGLLEHVDLRSTLPLNEDAGQHLCSSYSCVDEVNSTVQGLPNSDFLPFSGTPFSWKSKIHYASPVGNLWERFSSSSGSSEKRLSSNPELTCFPIEEDPSSNEENDNAEEVADEIEEACGPGVVDDFAEREPLAEITEACVNPGNSVAAGEKFPDRGSLDSCYIEVSFPGTHKKIKQKVRNHCSTKRSRDEGKEDQTPSFGHRITRGNVSLYQEFCKPKLSSKTSLRNGVQRLSQKEAKRNNIVSNMTSFIPLVHKKQAAAVCSGKRDIKVKSLEVAEAAKRREEEKEKERKMKKEALKLERARIEKENLREMELNKKKRQAEQKKRDADKASRKRQREEEERKRKHVAEARREQKLQNEKLRAGKLEKEKLRGKTDKKVNSSKESDNASGKNQGDKEGADENSFEKPDIELRTGGISTSDVQQVSTIFEDCHASSDCGGDRKGMSMFETSAKKVDLVTSTSQEKSYDMSPYQCSDDEEEEDDDVPTKKFVPAWASKINVALLLPLQQKLVPKTLFPLESFCSMDEVLLPRRLQLK